MNPPRNSERVVPELWDRLRSGELFDPAILVEQVSYLLMLRRIERTGQLEDPLLRWGELIHLSDAALRKRLESSMIRVVAAAMAPSIRPTMEEARFALVDPEQLRACMDAVASVSIGSEGRFFEELLGWLGTKGKVRGVRTPPAAAAAMVDLVDPMSGEVVCDLAAGTGGLLAEAYRHAVARRGAREPELHGFDINSSMARLAAFNLAFHEIESARIERADVLAPTFSADGGFDVVVCSPPFGGKRDPADVDERIAMAGGRTELLFLERCRQILRGRAAILVPEAVLFGQAEPFVRARREWLQGCRVAALILLAPGILGFTRVRSAILVASRQGTTENVWFCSIGEGEDRGDRARTDSQLGCVAEALRARSESREPEDPIAAELAREMFSASIDQIRENDWSLAPALYREASVAGAEEDPARLLAGLRATEVEIDAHLAAAERLLDE